MSYIRFIYNSLRLVLIAPKNLGEFRVEQNVPPV